MILASRIRIYEVDDQDAIRRLPRALYDRACTGQATIPRFGGQVIRVAELFVEVRPNGYPTGRIRSWYRKHVFNKSGALDPDWEAQQRRLLGMSVDLLADLDAGDKIASSDRHKRHFSRLKYFEETSWRPSHRVEQLLKRVALAEIADRASRDRGPKRTRCLLRLVRFSPTR